MVKHAVEDISGNIIFINLKTQGGLQCIMSSMREEMDGMSSVKRTKLSKLRWNVIYSCSLKAQNANKGKGLNTMEGSPI
jgi:hypothetical protein